ncbi:hypothetical protein ACKWTF_008430 [Chironomus riparius]
MLVLAKIYKSLSYAYSLRDKVYDDYYLLKDPPIPVMIIVFSYIILLKYGPSFMNDRAAYNVKFPMLIYNIFQVTANCIGASYCFYYCFIRTKYDIMCEPYIRGVDEISIAKRNLGYIYFMSKFWDLIDTVSILKKQISSDENQSSKCP